MPKHVTKMMAAWLNYQQCQFLSNQWKHWKPPKNSPNKAKVIHYIRPKQPTDFILTQKLQLLATSHSRLITSSTKGEQITVISMPMTVGISQKPDVQTSQHLRCM